MTSFMFTASSFTDAIFSIDGRMNAEGWSFEPTILYPANNNQFPEWRSRRSISQLVISYTIMYSVFRVFRLSVLTAVSHWLTAVFVDDRGCENDFEHFEQILRYIFVIACSRRFGAAAAIMFSLDIWL